MSFWLERRFSDKVIIGHYDQDRYKQTEPEDSEHTQENKNSDVMSFSPSQLISKYAYI